jgi:hypothetical protein
MSEEIRDLFRQRDEAVRTKDAAQLRSRQLVDLPFASSEGYLSVDDMTTEVLYLQEDEESNIVAFVKETYTPSESNHQSGPRSAFLIYFLVNTPRGWKIYQVR